MASVLSGRAGRQAAQFTAQQANELLAALQPIYTKSAADQRRFLTQGTGAAEDYLTGAGKTARTDLIGGTTAANKTLGLALNDLNASYSKGAGALGQAGAAWQPFTSQSNAGYKLYSDALGINGPGAATAARSAFSTSPGYQFEVDEATDQTARAANRYGTLGSGNTTDAIARLSHNLADKEYGSWLQNLQGYQGAAATGAGGMAGVFEELAKHYQNQGQGQAAIRGTMAGNQAQLGAGLAGADLNVGQLQASNAVTGAQGQAGITGNLSDNMAAILNNYYSTVTGAGQQGLMAGQQAAGNRLGLGIEGAKLGAQIIGGFAGMPVAGGSSGGSLGGNFLSSLFGK